MGCVDAVGRFASRAIDESTVIHEAIETGIGTLWRDVGISKYLNGDLSREEACDELGVEVVNRVDQAKSAVHDDLEWGLDELRV